MTDTTYATVAQLNIALANDPHLTSARAQELLNQVAAWVDATLAAVGYSVPVTGANDLLLLSLYVTNMAAASAWRELYQDQNEPPRIAAWERQFEAFLAGLADGSLRLPDQATAEAGGLTVGRLSFRRHSSSEEWA